MTGLVFTKVESLSIMVDETNLSIEGSKLAEFVNCVLFEIIIYSYSYIPTFL